MNKNLLIVFFVVFALGLLILGTLGGVFTPAKIGGKLAGCETIQGGDLYTSDDTLIMPGYDVWGYNYQAHLFNGYYCDAYRDAAWCQPYRDVKLAMKWNDAWLSNKDCTGEGFLDRHFGYGTYIGSGAWLTNHQSGEYEMNGKTCKWNYFVKIVAAPRDAYTDGGFWYAADGTELGPVIWGQFAIIQQVENDPCAGLHGLQYKGARPGVGNWADPDETSVE